MYLMLPDSCTIEGYNLHTHAQSRHFTESPRSRSPDSGFFNPDTGIVKFYYGEPGSALLCITAYFSGSTQCFWQSAEEGRNEMKYPVNKGR